MRHKLALALVAVGGLVASDAVSAGDFFCFGGKLYELTSQRAGGTDTEYRVYVIQDVTLVKEDMSSREVSEAELVERNSAKVPGKLYQKIRAEGEPAGDGSNPCPPKAKAKEKAPKEDFPDTGGGGD